jgi:hypothetical protein
MSLVKDPFAASNPPVPPVASRLRTSGRCTNTMRAAALVLTLSFPALARAQPAEPSRDTPAERGTDASSPRAVPANELPAQAPTPDPATQPPVAPTQLKIELPNGTSIRFGVLWQAQFEAAGNTQNDDYSKNFFLHRFAILLGGTVLHDFEYFIDTDFSDLFKAVGTDSVKNGPSIATKDALVTFRGLGDVLKIDAGVFLPPGARNSLLGGGGLHGLDFFRNTFRHNLVFDNQENPFGRDLGVQLRGLVGNGLLEYRLGTFQGRRSVPLAGPPSRAGARNSFRFAGRLQLNLLDAENTYLYAGTYLGKKRILSLGVSADYQHETDGSYVAYAADGALDVPLGPGGLTAEIDVIHRDGGDLVPLPKQTAFEAEAGYRIDGLKLSPIVRFERRWMDTAPGDETDVGAGLAYWAYGHTSNLKAFYQRIIPDDSALAYNQFNLQWQLAFY